MDINKTLKQFGLDYKEDDVYLALLQLGASGATEIAKKAGIKRTTVYDVLANLKNMGLVNETIKNNKWIFVAEDPEKLDKLIDEKKYTLAEIMPILKSMHNTKGTKTKVKYYEGVEGLKDVYRDTLNYRGVLLAFVSENIIQYLGKDFADEYKNKRKKAQIEVKMIVPDEEEIKKELETASKDLRIARIVSKEKFPFTIEMNIYGNKVAFMSFGEKMGVIVESTAIADNMRLLFELAWQGAEGEKGEEKEDDEYWA